ncbi:uncharacterized protein LOC115890186 [Sitophilus oryzae]|uniref:Uncharacterized protein LOC115890186 n=1 Tax=Sitophilus oryzae TaxID=7048 RepID=A0A6J2YSG0_SITOR|nr:uncharacterized protein LOC115890186 [Sitophilus oryzae]
MTDLLKRNGPVGAIYECSTKGWMNEELFLTWVKHFKKHSAASKENPVLLLLDNHSSHCSLATYEFCRENGIIMLSFPPHTSHKLQPLDLTVFGRLKSAYSNECSLFMRQNIHQKITPYDVAEIFNRAFIHVATIEKVQKGFEVSGIVPYRPNVFTDEDFLPATLSQIPVTAQREPDAHESQPSTSDGNAERQPCASREVEPQPSTSRRADRQPSISQGTESQASTSLLNTDKHPSKVKTNISIEEITALRRVEKRTKQKGKKIRNIKNPHSHSREN